MDIMKIIQKQKEIGFTEDDHTYWYKNQKFISVTTKIAEFRQQFDPYGEIAKRCAIKETNEKGYPITAQEIQLRWEHNNKKACDFGTEVHLFAEKILRDIPTNLSEDDRLAKYQTQVNRYLQAFKHKWQGQILQPELIVWNALAGIAGQVDLTVIHPDNTITLLDWKTNKDKIEENHNPYMKFMLDPVNHLPDNHFYGYALQLSIYQFLFQAWGFQVRDRILVQFMEDKYEEVKVPYMESEVLKILSFVR